MQKGRAVRFDLANSPCTVVRANGRAACRSTTRSRGCSGRRSTRNSIRQTPQPVTDPSEDGRVLDQDIRGSNVKPFIVTLTVGQLDQTATTPTTPTP